MKIIKSAILFMIILPLFACTWVKLTPDGEKVRILSAEEVSNCKRVGQTTSTTSSKLAGIKRHENAILDELKTLARNSAINLEGDTIVADGEMENGQQTYQVYRCVPQ